MLQEILALTIVFGAVIYTALNSYKFLFAAQKAGCGSGCNGCEVKHELKENQRKNKSNGGKFTFDPKDLAFK